MFGTFGSWGRNISDSEYIVGEWSFKTGGQGVSTLGTFGKFETWDMYICVTTLNI